jgi:hypothetical protein
MLLSVLLLGSICFPSSAMTAAAELLFRYQDRIPTRQEGIISTRSKLHFNQSHRVQSPGVTFALLRTPKNVLRDVLHAGRTHRMRQRGYGFLQRLIHRLDQIGRKRGIRKVFHPLRPVPDREGLLQRQPARQPKFPTSFSAWGKSCPATIMPPSTGGASDAARQAKAHPHRSVRFGTNKHLDKAAGHHLRRSQARGLETESQRDFSVVML